jgi:integrase
MAKMRPPRLPEQPVPVIAPDGLHRLLKACDGKGFDARRDTALIMFLLDTGACSQDQTCGLHERCTAGDRCEPLGSDGMWTKRGPAAASA